MESWPLLQSLMPRLRRAHRRRSSELVLSAKRQKSPEARRNPLDSLRASIRITARADPHDKVPVLRPSVLAGANSPQALHNFLKDLAGTGQPSTRASTIIDEILAAERRPPTPALAASRREETVRELLRPKTSESPRRRPQGTLISIERLNKRCREIFSNFSKRRFIAMKQQQQLQTAVLSGPLRGSASRALRPHRSCERLPLTLPPRKRPLQIRRARSSRLQSFEFAADPRGCNGPAQAGANTNLAECHARNEKSPSETVDVPQVSSQNLRVNRRGVELRDEAAQADAGTEDFGQEVVYQVRNVAFHVETVRMKKSGGLLFASERSGRVVIEVPRTKGQHV